MSLNPESRKVLVAFTESWRKIPAQFRVGLVESFAAMEELTQVLPAADEALRATEQAKAEQAKVLAEIAALKAQAAEDATRQRAKTQAALDTVEERLAKTQVALDALERRHADAVAYIAAADRRKAEDMRHAEALLKESTR